jgi:hypothetical protein
VGSVICARVYGLLLKLGGEVVCSERGGKSVCVGRGKLLPGGGTTWG